MLPKGGNDEEELAVTSVPFLRNTVREASKRIKDFANDIHQN